MDYYMYVSPPSGGGICWQWSVHRGTPARFTDLHIANSDRWGYALTERGARRKAKRARDRIRRRDNRNNVEGYKAYLYDDTVDEFEELREKLSKQ